MSKRFVLHLGILIAAAAVSQAQVKQYKPGFNLFSKEQDVQLGREAAAQVEQQMQVVRDAEIQGFTERIGKRLSSSSKAGGFPYSFKVVNENNINAFALPGGPTYVHTGLIKAAENEGQLAGVIAHEISHVALRHGTNQASKANLLQLPAMIAGVALGNGGLLGQLAQVGIGLGFNSVLLKYSRDAERQADLLGAQLMSEAGYNPIEMARFFEKLAAQGGQRTSTFFASHPDPGDRMRYIEEEVRRLPQRNYDSSASGDLTQIQSRLGSLPPPPANNRARADSQPAGQGDPRPTGQFREYRNGSYSIRYPGNWEAFGDQGGAAVTFAPRSGLVQDRGGSVGVAYGAMVSYYNSQSGGRPNLRTDTNNLIGQLRQSNPAMQTGGNQKSTRVAGQTALVTTLYNQSPLGGRELDMLVTVARPEGLLYLLFIAPQQDFGQLQGTFEEMLRSMRF
ncbi:MAG: M48 family metalloprotease [Bryobacteraceae bacterium]|nr:M48 family metalloprotease [Bryobacteraceae bacterium]